MISGPVPVGNKLPVSSAALATHERCTNPAGRLHDHCYCNAAGVSKKMTARVMYKLRVALLMSCTRAVGSKSFEAIWRDEHCLRRASQRCFTATWKHCRNA